MPPDQHQHQALKDAAHLWLKPSTNVGNTDSEALHHLVHEFVYTSVDEVFSGFCKAIYVKIDNDVSITDSDDNDALALVARRLFH